MFAGAFDEAFKSWTVLIRLDDESMPQRHRRYAPILCEAFVVVRSINDSNSRVPSALIPSSQRCFVRTCCGESNKQDDEREVVQTTPIVRSAALALILTFDVKVGPKAR